MERTGKGTVISLASLFPAEEAQKAGQRVQDAIAEREKELDRLRGFIADNNNLINLVQKLPEELHHDIMVPFGKAAFFPGRLIHTNEYLVLLGEGYYAERTSKQAIEILRRRGMSLDFQVNSLEAVIKDHKAEASFFTATASEAAEGLVEIREDYVEENSSKEEFKSGLPEQDVSSFAGGEKEKATADDEEFVRMMSRLDELEKEELAAERSNHSDENQGTTSDFDEISYQRSVDSNLQTLEGIQPRKALNQTNDKSIATKFPEEHKDQEDISDQLNFASLALRSQVIEGKNSAQNLKNLDACEKAAIYLEEKIVQATTTSKSEVQHQASRPSFDSQKAFSRPIVEHADNTQRTSREENPTSSQVRCQASEPSFDSGKAFTGSIIEHAENLHTPSREQNSTSQVSGSQPSKPVSRFKMQRR